MLFAWLCLAHNHHGTSYLLIKFLSNFFVCESSYSVCVCGNGEGEQRSIVMCFQSQTLRHKCVCDAARGKSTGIQGNVGSLETIKTKYLGSSGWICL